MTALRLLGVALGVVTAALPDPVAALTRAQEQCRIQVGRVGRAYARATAAGLRRCHDRVGSGRLPAGTSCEIEPATARRIAAAGARLGAGVARGCDDGVLARLTFGGQCHGAATVAALRDCLLDSHVGEVLALAAALYGSDGAIDGGARRCRRVVGWEVAHSARTRHALLARCKDAVATGRLDAGTDCGARAEGAAAAGDHAAFRRMLARCPAPSVVAWGSPCDGAPTTETALACLVGVHRDAVANLVTTEYGSGPSGGSATARRIADPVDCVRGPLSRCRSGDYLLANDRIRVVVQDVQRNLFGIGQFGGQIIDADHVRRRGEAERDNFEEWATSIDIENTAHYTSLEVVNDGADGQPAILRATGVDDLLDFLNPSSVVEGLGFAFPPELNDRDLPLEVMTDYVLEPGVPWVAVRTTVANTSAAPLSILLGEFLNGSGEVDLFQPAYGFGEPVVTTRCAVSARSPCDFLAYAGYQEAADVSYGYVHDVPGSSVFTVSGVSVPLLGAEVILGLVGAAAPNVALAPAGTPGDRVTRTRWFVVGDGSVSSISDARNVIRHLVTGRLEGTVTAGGVPVAAAAVAVLGDPADGPGGALGSLPRNVVTVARTDAAGRYALTLPPGSYRIAANVEGVPFEGGAGVPVEHAVEIVAYAAARADVALPAPGRLTVTVTDPAGRPIAAKVSVVGFDPSPPLGNTQNVAGLVTVTGGVFSDVTSDGLPFGLARVLFLDHHGDSGSVALEPGAYRVVVSHGPEYSAFSEDVTVGAGETVAVAARIARVVDSSGFVGSDFHVHSIDSPDSQVSRRDRIVSMLAEGVDFFTPSDHDVRVDFQPDVAALGASALIGTATSAEITSFDYGHLNAWPMTIDPAAVNGGSVDFAGAAPPGEDYPARGHYNRTPAEIVAAAHADPGIDTVQINHIHTHFGLAGESGLAIDTGTAPPQSHVAGTVRRLDPTIPNYFTDTFDALELWNGDGMPHIEGDFLGQNMGDWFNLLNQGIRRTGVADSDTHRRISSLAGAPRTMVASPVDDPGALAALAETLSASVNAGRAFGTIGPFVRVHVTAESTGETAGLELGRPTVVRTADGAVRIEVAVQSPAWAAFDRVEYYVNSPTIRRVETRSTGAGPVLLRRYGIAPDRVQTAGADFAVRTVTVEPSVPGGQRVEATTRLELAGLTRDVWIVVVVRGTAGVSPPLFPILPNGLDPATNRTLADLIDGNLGEGGSVAVAFTNPLFVDVDGNGFDAPGLRVVEP